MHPYIMFTGIDGSGKTTTSKLVAEKLPALWTREPYKLVIDAEIPHDRNLQFVYDRYLHMLDLQKDLLISPVVQDRGVFCNLAYQGSEGINIDNLWNMQPSNLIMPNLIIHISTPIDTCINRLIKRKESFNREYLEQVYYIYYAIFELYYKNKLHIIDARDLDLNGVVTESLNVIRKTFNL